MTFSAASPYQSPLIVAQLIRLLVPYRDRYDEQHGAQTAVTSVMLAEGINLPARDVALIRIAAELHDLGKLTLPDSLINKPGRLSLTEQAIMRLHTMQGHHIASVMKLGSVIEDIILHHHENMDGSGYPDGLIGEKISIHARIVHLADAFDALTSERSYRPAHAPREAIAILQNEEHKFDPRLLQILRRKVTNWTSTLA